MLPTQHTPAHLDALEAHPAANLFPMLAGTDLAELADDIKRHGLIEPIWLFSDPERGTVVLDGRNRLAACRLAGIEPRTRIYTGPDPIAFSLSLNEKRRHLNAGQRAALALEVEPLYAAEAKRRQAAAVAESNRVRAVAPNPFVADLPQMEPTTDPTPAKSRDHAAKAVGASGRAVQQAKRIADKAPDLFEKVKSGQVALDRADRIVRDREAEQKRVDEARREASMLDITTTTDLRQGDFRHVLANVRNLDAIITDPPYPHEFIPLLADLGAWADQALKPDGVLVILMGQTYLPEVYRLLEGGRPYRWTGCYLTPGAGYTSMARRLQSNWKPLLVYGGGPRFNDTLRSEGTDADAKNHHEWGQDYSAFHEIVRRFTKAGDTIADPFMGSGTTLLAGKAQGRNVIGAEIDAEHYETARRRLS